MIIEITNRRIRIKTKELITAGSRGVDKAEFTFDDMWHGLLKTAVFSDGVHEISIAESKWKSGGCAVPWEVLQSEGSTLTVGVFGVDSAGNVVMPTITADVCVISPPVNMNALSGQEPTKTVYEQWVADIHSDYLNTVSAKTAAEAAKTNAEAAKTAAEAAQNKAEAAKTNAEAAKTAAETAQGKAEAAKTDAEAAKAAAEAAQTETESLRALSDEARIGAQNAELEAQAAQNAAETAKTGAQAARVLAESAQGSAETALDLTNEAYNKALTAQLAAQASASAAKTSEDKSTFNALTAATAATDAKGSADNAAQAAVNSGYAVFSIDSRGHLIETRTENVPDDFTFKMTKGRLILSCE